MHRHPGSRTSHDRRTGSESGGSSSCDHRRALDSVLYDLGRISGLGGPVEYEGGFLKFRPEHRRAVLEWLYNDQMDGVIRSLGRFNFNIDEEVEP